MSQPLTYMSAFGLTSSSLSQLARVMLAPTTLLSAADTIALSQSLMRAYGI
jgi:hypothetical protein